MKDSTQEKYWKKICSYCAFRERSSKEVYDKLRSYELAEEDIQFFIRKLEKESFLDEKRFAEVYARGKFNSRSWGKLKIGFALKQKGVEQNEIVNALNKIENQEYADKALYLAEMRSEKLDIRKKPDQKKLISYMASKGYEYDMIFKVLGLIQK